MTNETGKTRAIIAHITIIGWVIALIQNNNDKDEFASFYLRQMMGLVLIGLLAYILSSVSHYLGLTLNVLMLILWVLSILGAVNGKKELTPIVGPYFQDWFKSI